MNYKISDLVNSSSIEITKDNISLDGTLVGCDFGTALNIFPCLNFIPASNGAIWATFKRSDIISVLKDIRFQLSFTLNSTDASKNVKLIIDTWASDTGELPSASPDASYTETIVSAVANTNKLAVIDFATAKVALASMNANTKFISIKITRDNTVASNYTGTFQLISIKAYQI